jgi:hypothetical protein
VAGLINKLDILAFGVHGQTIVPTGPEICCLGRLCLTDCVEVVVRICIRDAQAASIVCVGVVFAS